MNVKCKNCLPKEGIEIPNFNETEKYQLIELTIQSPAHSIKFIIDNFNFNHRDAKYIVNHINKTYGQCNSCIFDKLDKEYMHCPKCGALNFNCKTNNEI